MKANRVLSAFIGICVLAGVAVATPAGQRGGRANAPNNGVDVLAPGRGASAPNVPTAWWTDAALMTRLGLTDLQKLRIENSFLAHRQNLASAKETLEKEEAQLSKLLDADSIDRSAVQLQVNKVILARSEMERVNSAMSLEMREQLTRAQWVQLQQPNGGRGGRGDGAAVSAGAAPDSFAAKYDAAKPVSLEGTVSEFKFQDPHSYVVFDAIGNDGKMTSWTGELGSSTLLARQGWSATTLKPGDKIRIEGSHSRNPSENLVNLRNMQRIQ